MYNLHFCNTETEIHTMNCPFASHSAQSALVCHSMKMKFHSQKNALHSFGFVMCVWVCNEIKNRKAPHLLLAQNPAFVHSFVFRKIRILCFVSVASAALVFIISFWNQSIFFMSFFEISCIQRTFHKTQIWNWYANDMNVIVNLWDCVGFSNHFGFW